MLATALVVSCSRLITVTGAGVVRSLRRTREPVTTISSCACLRSPVGAASGAAVAAGTFSVGVTSPGVEGEGGVAGGGVCCCAAAWADKARDASAASLSGVNLSCMISSCGVYQLFRG